MFGLFISSNKFSVFCDKNRCMQNTREIEFQYVTNQAGEKTAVLLPIAEFEEIMEDLHDLALIAERRDEETISLEELKKELKRDGIL